MEKKEPEVVVRDVSTPALHSLTSSQLSGDSEQGDNIFPTCLLLNDEVKEDIKEVKYQRLISNFKAISTIDIDAAVKFLRNFIVSYEYILISCCLLISQ